MSKYYKYPYTYLIIIISLFLVLPPAFSGEEKPTSEMNDKYYQNLIQVLNLISFSLYHIYSIPRSFVVEAEYSYVLRNINFDKVPLPNEINNVYQRIIETISKLRPDEAKIKEVENYIENQYFTLLEHNMAWAIDNTIFENEKITHTLMRCSKNLYFPFLLNTNIMDTCPFLELTIGKVARSNIMGLINEWEEVIQSYYYNKILPQHSDAYLMENKDILLLLSNSKIKNQEVCLLAFNDHQNTEKRIVQIPIFWLLYTFSADKAANRELAELCINKFLECYKSILIKDIFLEVAYIRKLECLLWKNPEFKDANVNQEILTTAENACKYIDDKNVGYKIFLSAILHKLGKPEKTKELLLGINPEMIKGKNKKVEGFYKLAMYDWEHGNDIYNRMKLLVKIWYRDIQNIEDLEEIKEAKIPDVLFMLGRRYLYQDRGRNIEKGIAYLEEAHQLGCDDATYFLAGLYTKNYFWLKSKIKKDEKKGFEYYQQLAEKGNEHALVEIGRFYYEGRVVRQDFAKAKEYFEKAGSNGSYWLGVMYSRGDGVPQDYQKAYEHFLNNLRSGSYNNPYKDEAYIAIGDLHFAGKIDVVNYIKAMEYYKNASQSPEAQVRMAYIYENGYEIQKSYTKAKECYENAGKKGHLEAFLRLGDYYLYGLAGKKDYVLSYAYYTLVIRIAKEGGDHPNAEELAKQAERARKKLLPHIWNLWSGLTPEEVKEAEEIANAWEYGKLLFRKEQ